ncbi:MAG: AmmeMemoRadiSam system radical SAM enzyme [Patescibacteria group bacterium]
MYQAKFYKKLNNNLVQCTLCSHYCSIKDNEVGICHVRENKAGTLYSLVYGHPVAQNIDPIEKKPLFHFLPGSLTYSIGTLGCNFTCANCQNWDISQAKPLSGLKRHLVAEAFLEPKKIIQEAIGNNCKSISYTYNEPTIFTEYALDIMKLAHENNLKNVWVSNGFMTDVCLKAILPYLDAINIDLKSIENDFYKNNCSARLKPTLENLKKIKQEQVHLEITTLIIPSLSDDFEMLKKIADFIVSELDTETPWHISRFSRDISWKLKKLTSTREDIIYSAYDIGKQAGLKYVYTGNMSGDSKENTYCSKCNELAIRRMGYHIERLDNKGRCASCDKGLDIVE